jgi:hypothetical protein
VIETPKTPKKTTILMLKAVFKQLFEYRFLVILFRFFGEHQRSNQTKTNALILKSRTKAEPIFTDKNPQKFKVF